jgi:hypothetical protein
MRKFPQHSSTAFPMLMARLTAASWETVFRRTLMMALGTCTPAEYHRMVTEKSAALQFSTVAFMQGRGTAAILAPFVNRTRANVRRLRRKP